VTGIQSNGRQTEEAIKDSKGGATRHDVLEITKERPPCHLPLASNGKQKLQRDKNGDIRDQERR